MVLVCNNLIRICVCMSVVLTVPMVLSGVPSRPSHATTSFFGRYGFERKPYLLLSAKPKLFNRQVTFSYVTDWIEKRLIELVEVRASTMSMAWYPSVKSYNTHIYTLCNHGS